MTSLQPQTVQGRLAGPPVRALTRSYANGTVILPHCHERGQVVYAASGVMELSAGDDLWIIPPQRALWMPPDLLHSLRAMGTVELRTVFVHPAHIPMNFPKRPAVVSISPLLRELMVIPTEASRGIYGGADAVAFWTSAAEIAPSWRNDVTLRSLEQASEYEPGMVIDRIGPTPLLMIVADKDDVTPTDLALAAYNRATEPKRLRIIAGGHFAPYLAQFEAASSTALAWFTAYLTPAYRDARLLRAQSVWAGRTRRSPVVLRRGLFCNFGCGDRI
ncbi:AraC family ligand binding domain-containing protein [Rhodoblastus acidophilus]|uniref:AraC family ligand binding domain-containing protein n=1 Tax=Rhodoblastus acidophilus TaxID=1074 RepID=UPI0022246E70|nr:AraC family ligand binding domain-containing protein [Rhodoblastus acidophilus]